MKLTVLTLVGATLVCPAGLRAQTVLNQTPSRVVGQLQVQAKSINPNVVEGKEFLNPWSVAVDRSSTPPAVYVADFGNNRVLGWQNAVQFQNGAAADIVIGQVDPATTSQLGPGTSRPTGLSGPGGLVVDAQGNLYVVDTGNNRILRFPKPFSQADPVKFPDLVIGQPNFNVRDPNPNGVSNRTYATTTGSTAARSGLSFDPQGNLWASDPLNNRVLRYPAASLREGNNGPAADMVLGQSGYNTNTAPPQTATARFDKSILLAPSGIAVDPDGRVYVADTFFRVLIYAPPFFIGKSAVRIMGIGVLLPPGQQPEPGRPTITEYTFGSPQGPFPPEGVFMIGNRPAVVDSGNNRVLIFDPFTQWPAETELIPSPPARIALGQRDLSSGFANMGMSEPNAATLNFPLAGAFHNNEVYVVDSFNNRVSVFPTQTTGASAIRLLGQASFSLNAPNTVEGRELFLSNGFAASQNLGGDASDGAGVAIDNRSNPPHLYVADTFNNRILGYRDARTVRPGDRADLVIGQDDLNRVLINAPQNSREVFTESGLYRPSGLVVDSNGNLYVADSGNSRVLRFPSPFNQPTVPPPSRPRANLVIGQESFFRKVTDPSARTMADPVGVAFTVEGHLLVSDAVHHRVLMFRKPAGGDFTNGMAADRVIGQSDFVTGTRGIGNNRLNGPRHITLDTDDRLFVADAGNNRVVIYDRVTAAENDPAPALSLTGLPNPQGVYASPATGELWVTATRGTRVLRYPQFNRLLIDPRSDYEVASSGPLAVTQDQYGTLYVAEAINRVAIYFNALAVQSAGNYASRPLSPGMIAILYPRSPSAPFSTSTASYNELPNPVPLPKELVDTQVLFDNQPVPLYFVSPGQINFYIPMGAPTSGAPEIQVVRVSTGQILASGFLQMARVSPALFVQGGGEMGQVAALNEDNTVNEPGNPIPRGQVVQIFGTGQGFVTGAPPDGSVPSGPVPTDERPTVIINSRALDEADILYSGLAPSLAGVWQLNVRVPDFVPPGNQIDVVVVLRSVPSNQGSRGQIIRTTIAVR